MCPQICSTFSNVTLINRKDAILVSPGLSALVFFFCFFQWIQKKKRKKGGKDSNRNDAIKISLQNLILKNILFKL